MTVSNLRDRMEDGKLTITYWVCLITLQRLPSAEVFRSIVLELPVSPLPFFADMYSIHFEFAYA